MKKIMLMLAFCGALVTMSAQTKTKSESTKREGRSTEQGMKPGSAKRNMPYRYEPRMEQDFYWDEMTGLSTTTYSPTPVGRDRVSYGTKGSWKIDGKHYATTYTQNYTDGNSSQKVVTVIVSNRSGNGNVQITASDVSYKNKPVATLVYTKEVFPRGPVCKSWDVKNVVDGTNQSYAMCSIGRPAWISKAGSRVKHAFYSDSY